jgi:hypothetical protein
MTQTERIAYFEEILDRSAAASARLDAALEAFAALRPLVRELDAYYGGEDWRRDLADDEAGRLPADLKRGVLSEDAAWDALAEDRRLLARMLEIVADSLRG